MNRFFPLILFTFLILISCSSSDDEGTPKITGNLNLFINEINAKGNPDWIELYNDHNKSIDLSAFKLWDDSEAKYRIPDGIEIEAKGYLIFNCNDEGVGLNTNFKLSSTGEVIVLEDDEGEVIDVVEFPALGDGLSFSRIPDGSINWEITNNITKEFTNSGITTFPTPDVYINEFLADNVACCADPDASEPEYNDWIELYNAESESVDVAGFYLSDDPTMPFLHQLPRDKPQMTTIPPGGFLLLWADSDSIQGDNHLSFKLSALGESIVLSNPAGIEIDMYTFDVQVADVSTGRLPNGGNSWQAFSSPTPGTSNNND